MPKIMEILGYIIYFWSNEGQPAEPLHVHISKTPNKNGTKIWITSDGDTIIEHNKSMIPPKDLRKLTRIISDYHQEIEAEWKKFFKTENIAYVENYRNKDDNFSR